MAHNVKLDYDRELNRLTVDDNGTINTFQFGKDRNDRVFDYMLQALDDLDNGESGGGANADWSENDPEASSYVKNRTHYKESTSETLMTSKIKPGYSKGFILTADGPAASLQPVVGSLYNVTFNGVSYDNLEAYKVFGDSLVTLGNSRMAPGETGSEYNVDVPFCLVYNNLVGNAKWYVVTESLGTFNFSIEEVSSGNTDSGELTIDSSFPWMRSVLDAPLLENYVGEYLTLSINNFSASYEIKTIDGGYATSNFSESEFTEGNIGVMSSNFGQETQLFFIAAEPDSGYSGDFTLSSDTEVIHKLSSDYIQKAASIADGDNGFTTGDQVYQALQGVSGEQSDWSVSDSSSPAFIKNKPTIPNNIVSCPNYPASNKIMVCDNGTSRMIKSSNYTIDELVTTATNHAIDVVTWSLSPVASTGNYTDLKCKPMDTGCKTVFSLGTIINHVDFDPETGNWIDPEDPSNVKTPDQVWGRDPVTGDYITSDLPWDAFVHTYPEEDWYEDGLEYYPCIWGGPSGYEYTLSKELGDFISSPSDLLNYSIRLTFNGVQYILPIQEHYSRGDGGEEPVLTGYYVGQRDVENTSPGVRTQAEDRLLWTHPFKVYFELDSSGQSFSSIRVSLRMTENVSLGAIEIIDPEHIGTPSQIPIQNMPVAESITSDAEKLVTGKQVYKYINYPTTDGTYVLKVQDGVPSWVPAT